MVRTAFVPLSVRENRSLSSNQIKLHVGSNFDAVAERVAAAWHRAEGGADVHEHRVTFLSWESVLSVRTAKPYELLRHLRQHPVNSVAALARDIARDYKRLHQDVAALAGIGLIERDGGLRAPFDEIQTTISI